MRIHNAQLKTQNDMKTKIELRVQKIGYGNYLVKIYSDSTEIGMFKTTDGQLIDDIYEMNSNGFENDLIMFESFDELRSYCLDKIH